MKNISHALHLMIKTRHNEINDSYTVLVIRVMHKHHVLARFNWVIGLFKLIKQILRPIKYKEKCVCSPTREINS